MTGRVFLGLMTICSSGLTVPNLTLIEDIILGETEEI